MPEFVAWSQQSSPEQCVPTLWHEDKPLSPIARAMNRLLLIQVSTLSVVCVSKVAQLVSVLGIINRVNRDAFIE